MPADTTLKDIALAPEGERKIQWVSLHAHTLNEFRRTRLADGSLRGRKIAMAIHLEAKTAYLAWLLHEAGAEVSVTGSNSLSTQDDVAAALARRGLCVHATHAASPEEFDRQLLLTLDSAPDLVIDDGCELVSRLHQKRPKLVGNVRGASEETTSGILRLRAMQKEGVLKFPVIGANQAMCKHLFDNRYGTGQSTMTAIMSATNLLIAGKSVVVVGYGWCGRGLALYARGFGARVTIVEIDPIKGIEALSDGFAVAPMSQAAASGDIFITATGSIHVIRREHFERMKDGAILANAGNFGNEIDVPALAEISKEQNEARRNITQYILHNGKRLYLVAQGALANIAASDGHPVEIMDMSFSVQALAVHYLANHAHELAPGLHPLPEDIDRDIARTRLRLLGVQLEEETPEQRAYGESWQLE
ncbi:MAG: adenosylhomocysteinase, partial [Acidobacteria bacterium]|nr:adenosylhomocysteinase [Acidobacteriota bacterium]